MDNVSSRYTKLTDPVERKSRLLNCAKEEVARLERAQSEGYDVEKELARAREYVKAFGG